MSTIEKIIPYRINEYQIEYLRNAWIINWIGWEWHNIEILLLNIIIWAYWFDEKKAKKLLSDIRILSYYYDIDVFFRLWFYKANLKFSYRLFKLIHFDKFFHRIWIWILTFVILNKQIKNYKK